jgi:hypothetical protein
VEVPAEAQGGELTLLHPKIAITQQAEPITAR